MDPVAKIIEVAPLSGIRRSLSYAVIDSLWETIGVGSLVKIPLGRRVEQGIVLRRGAADYSGPALKQIFAVDQPFPVIREDGIRLAQWMASYYACGLDQVFDVMIPRAVRKGMGPKQRRMVRLQAVVDPELREQLKRAPKQARVVEFLAGQVLQKPWARVLLQERLGATPTVLDALVEKGILSEFSEQEERHSYGDSMGDAEQVAHQEHELTSEQQAALDALRAGLQRGCFETHLLQGVTGSGKTEVYLRLMKTVLNSGGGVIFLVPEVALTPQTVGRLRSRFEAVGGERVVVWHSHLSSGERYDAWRAVANGEARVVVGARSAVFAPVGNLRLIVVDEEHEPAYKQEEVPRYHGRDVAVYRARLNNALCLLGSATPSLETQRNGLLGKYKVVRLLKRVDDRQLPLMHVVDMRREKGHGILSNLLVQKLVDRCAKKEQTILFLNRRGHDASLHCPDCGYVAMCDHCDITLTHHFHDKRLRCHMCGDESMVPRACPQCKSPKIHYKGSGTQKVELQVQKLLPHAKVVRIDADTMKRRHAFREQLANFRTGKVDILVGTQMIAKGLDFPNVTLVGLLDADISMHMPDFRASERTFQLLVQVSGRAGRGDRAGEVVVQTYMPSAPPIQFSRQLDFDGFYDEELAHRKEFAYPPYRHLVHHLFRSKNREKLEFYSREWVRTATPMLQPLDVEIRGPAPCPVERVQDFFRFQVWYLMPRIGPVLPVLAELRQSFKWDKEIIQILDVDAVNLI